MRAGRLVSLLLLLQSGGRMTARSLAEQLEVSERTVLRDLEALSGAGVPVYATRGPNGGFELLDTFERELPALPTELSRGRGRIRRIRVRLAPAALQMAVLLGRPEGWRPRSSAEPLLGREDWLEGSFKTESYDVAVRDLLALGPGVEVVLPAELRATMAEIGRWLVDLHRPLTSGQPEGATDRADADGGSAQPAKLGTDARAGSGPT